MAEADYYTVLGINRTANEDDIKKAYRKMALQWHPDKNPDNKEEAERRFKVISEAYQVLSDANKRSAYDRYGKSGSAFASGGQFNFHFQSPADLFQQFFGGGDGLSFLFGHHGSSNGHFNMNSHRGYQSPPIRVFTFSPGSGGFPFQMEGTYFDNPFCNSPFHSGGSEEDDFYRDMGRLHSPYGSDAQKLCQSTVNTINGQKVVTTIEVDGLEETITVETDGVITSRTVNGVEQCASQNMPPSFHRSTVPRTLRTRPTESHSTDRLRFCGAPGSSGCSASSFPNSASNSFLFKDSNRRSTADSYTARPTSPTVVSSSVRLERKDAPASKEVPVRKESPAPKGVSVHKEVPTGKEVAERKEVPAVRKVVPAGLEVPEGKELPVRTEDLMQEKIPNGKEVGPDLQDRRDNDVPKSSGVPECRPVSDRSEVAENSQRIYAESLSALSSKSNRKTLLYSRVACNSQIRILYEVKLL